MRFPSVPEGQGDTGSTGGHIPVRGDATLLSSHVGRPCYVRRAAQRTVATKAINFVERTRRTPGFWTLGNFVCGLRLVDVESVAVGHFQDVQDGLPARDASGGLARFGLLPDGQR
jgi:hypothetical protein